MLDTLAWSFVLSVVEQRCTAVQEVLGGMPVVEVAARSGVSRQSVHTWMCGELAAYVVPATLVHGELHLSNVAQGPAGTCSSTGPTPASPTRSST